MTQFIDITKPRFRVIAAIPDDESIAEMRARFEAAEAAPFPPSPSLLRTPAEASERPSGLSRLGRGLAMLLDEAGRPAILEGPAPSSDGLKTAAQAAAKLNCSIKTLNAHVAA